MEGRDSHRVIISKLDMLTRGVLRGPTFYHFSYSCSCAAEKPFCIHIGLVIMKEFGEMISD